MRRGGARPAAPPPLAGRAGLCGGAGAPGRGPARRLAPFGLPVRFCASDAAADGRVRDIELHRERVVLRRSLSGMRMALNMPVKAFDGISLQVAPGEGGEADLLAIVLEQSDPSLTLTLQLTARPDEAPCACW